MKTLAILCLSAGIATAAPHARRTVVVPLTAGIRDSAEARVATQIETALVEATRRMSMLDIVNLESGKLRGPTRIDAKADPRPRSRALVLLREQGAELAIVAEPQPLGDGAVVYLQVIEAGGQVLGSTTVALSAELLHAGSAELERPLRGGLVQVIEPARFVGRMELHVDVRGAEIELDGRNIPSTGVVTTIEQPVGTHAVRITHPAYRDFLRFVDVAFDRTRVENVTLALFPLTEGEMDQRKRKVPLTKVKVPWYRSWWALTLTGAVLVGATAGIVYGARATISADETTRYRAVPTP